MDNPKAQLVDKLKTANYVLVTVGHDPSIDQLAALIGTTLALNKAGKHAAAVFSGQVPSTLEFLKPEDTIEKTTDSLRDFIIALDKSKADKLRYKVEDDVVRIFITPYKTSITQDDLEYSQGDFNVDVVIALGVTRQDDLDEAILSHGRILHDATVATVNLSSEGDLGSIHWQDRDASSLSEMMTELAQLLGENIIDNQIATALLTGIVAETERFSNEKTSARVMSMSALLMGAGANQQLVASELAQQPVVDGDDLQIAMTTNEPVTDNDSDNSDPVAELELPPVTEDDDQALEISHDVTEPDKSQPTSPESDEEYFSLPEPALTEAEAETPTAVPEAENTAGEPQLEQIDHLSSGSKLITEPPTLGGQLTANSHVEELEPSSDPLSIQANNGQETLLSRGEPANTQPIAQPVAETEQLPSQPQPIYAPQMVTGLTPPPPSWVTPQENPLGLPDESDSSEAQTLADLEVATHAAPEGVDAARDEVMKALNSDTIQPLEPVQALNAQPMLDSLNTQAAPEIAPDVALNDLPNAIPSLPLPPASDVVIPVEPFDPATFGINTQPGTPIPGAAPQVIDPNAAPPVPPPIPFNFGTPPTPPQA